MAMIISNEEALIDQYLDANQIDRAVKLLRQLAIQCAQNSDFDKAEALRDRLYEVDSMALSSIIQINEAIEAEKKKVIKPDQRRLWFEFFEALSSEEANAFFFALQEQRLESEVVVLRQGQPNDRLYLVNQGRLKIVYKTETNELVKELLIRRLNSGDLFGEDTFFSLNVCTASVVTLAPVSLSYLTKNKLERLGEKLPFLESNLQKICRPGKSVFDWLRQQGADRRSFKRFNLHTKVTVQVLTPDGKTMLQRPLTAELWDISKNGLSFYFQSKNREAVQRLIGRTLGLRFNLHVNGKPKTAALTGVVHGVQNHPLDEYSVHVKLTRNLSSAAIQTIRQIVSQH